LIYDANFEKKNLLALCRMFIRESSTFKILINNLCEEFNSLSETIYYLNKNQEELLEALINNFDITDFNINNSTQSYYRFMRYRRGD